MADECNCLPGSIRSGRSRISASTLATAGSIAATRLRDGSAMVLHVFTGTMWILTNPKAVFPQSSLVDLNKHVMTCPNQCVIEWKPRRSVVASRLRGDSKEGTKAELSDCDYTHVSCSGRGSLEKKGKRTKVSTISRRISRINLTKKNSFNLHSRNLYLKGNNSIWKVTIKVHKLEKNRLIPSFNYFLKYFWKLWHASTIGVRFWILVA